MAGQVVGEDELLDLTNKGYPCRGCERRQEKNYYIIRKKANSFTDKLQRTAQGLQIETSWLQAERLLSLLLTALHSVYSIQQNS